MDLIRAAADHVIHTANSASALEEGAWQEPDDLPGS
jgi:hypothetical protein